MCDMGEHSHVADTWGLGSSLITHMDTDQCHQLVPHPTKCLYRS